MRIPLRFSVFPVAIISLALAGLLPSAIFADGLPKGSGAAAAASSAPAPRPRPDTDKKVWTNDDVIALGAPYGETGASTADAAAATSDQVPVIQSAAPPILEPSAAALPEDQEDPRRYAEQMAFLESQLASIDSQAQRLRDFQATSTGLQTGLGLNAPCDGITTDNLLAQLDARQQQILVQIDDLSDTARHDGIAPGILAEGAAPAATPLSADEQRAVLTKEFRERSDELAQAREEIQGMQGDASAQNITLLQPSPGDGGNMTTDLLQRLDDRAQTLQTQIDTTESDARTSGVEPGALR